VVIDELHRPAEQAALGVDVVLPDVDRQQGGLAVHGQAAGERHPEADLDRLGGVGRHRAGEPRYPDNSRRKAQFSRVEHGPSLLSSRLISEAVPPILIGGFRPRQYQLTPRGATKWLRPLDKGRTARALICSFSPPCPRPSVDPPTKEHPRMAH